MEDLFGIDARRRAVADNIQKALGAGYETNPETPENNEENIQKGRVGVYEDNAENRRLNRVGQAYGHKKQEEMPKGKVSTKKENKSEEKDLAEYAVGDAIRIEGVGTFMKVGRSEWVDYDPNTKQKGSKRFNYTEISDNGYAKNVTDIKIDGKSVKSDVSSHAAKASDGALKRAAADEKAPKEVRDAANAELEKRGGKSENKNVKSKINLKDELRYYTEDVWDKEGHKTIWGRLKGVNGKYGELEVNIREYDNGKWSASTDGYYSDEKFNTPEEAFKKLKEFVVNKKENNKKNQEKNNKKEKTEKEWDNNFEEVDSFSYAVADYDEDESGESPYGDEGPNDKDILSRMLDEGNKFDFITEHIKKFGEKKTIERLVKNNETVSPKFARMIVRTYKGK